MAFILTIDGNVLDHNPSNYAHDKISFRSSDRGLGRGLTHQWFGEKYRFTISNMAIECGAKAGLMEADKKVLAWVKAHSKKKPNPVTADKDAKYDKTVEIDISKLEPQIAKPHTVDNVVPISKLGDVPVQQGLIGTCTGSDAVNNSSSLAASNSSNR